MKNLTLYFFRLDGKIYSLILLLGIISMVALYMYMIGISVVNVVINKELQQSIALVQSDITELESSYIAEQYNFNKEKATALGFVENDTKIYIATGDNNLVVTRNDI